MANSTLRRPRAATTLVPAILLAACSSAPGPQPATPAAPPPNDIHWVRTAAEYRAIFESTYRFAEEAVRGLAERTDGEWAVIIDADETLLDNSLYQLRRSRMGLGYTSESWNDWVREEAAPALPGAVEFTRAVKSMGGHVAVVTNRVAEVCEETRRNLTAVGIAHDVVLCRTDASEKETRFEMVREGATGSGLPQLQVVAWVGDNIEDFPGGRQSLRGAPPGALDDFGQRFFVLPNPMYGSWTSNAGG